VIKWENGVAVVQRFEDLECWKAARTLARGVYRAVRSQSLRTDNVLSRQMKRAAVSISSNIAEGFERGTRRQQIEYCFIAKGSAGELRSQIILARDNDLLDEEAYGWLLERCERCSRLLHAYIRSLQKSAGRFRGLKYGKREDGEAAC